MEPFDFEKIKERAIRILARRDHSVVELKRKLNQRALLSSQDFERLVSYLKDLGYLVPETELAGRWVAEWQKSGRGKIWITAKLREKGLPQVKDLDEGSELEAAQTALTKRLRGRELKSLSYEEKGKLGRFLISRGFSTSLVATLLK